MRLIENSNTRKLYSSLTEESPLNKDDEDFKDAVIRDFITYLDDVYGVETLEDAERVRKNVTNDDVNNYFTSLFYDIWDNDDFDTADVAEEIIRREFHVPDTSNKQDNDANSTVEETDTAEKVERRQGSIDESVKLDEDKEKKEDKRVVMQQGNVTCFKENDNTYYVFENENDNEAKHDNEESAMQDFMERVGIDIENELKEE